MNISQMVTRPGALAAMCLAVAPVLAGAQQAAYKVQDFGEAGLSGLNNVGQVVGHMGQEGFVTGPNGVGRTSLGALLPSAINDSGWVVADDYGSPSGHVTVLYQPGVGSTPIAQPGWTSSLGRGVSASGEVVGLYSTGGASQAFITGPGGQGVHSLGVAEPAAINASGQVAGRGASADLSAVHAVVTGPSGMGVKDLGTLPTAFMANPSSVATDVSNSGRVVGYSDYQQFHYPYSSSTYTTTRAFLTGPGGEGMTQLGLLPIPVGATDLSVYADGVNDAGQVVGEYSYHLAGWTTVTHAFITGADGQAMVDLNDLVKLENGDYFQWARHVNEQGQFIARSFLGHSYLLTPVPEVSSLAMWSVGGLAIAAMASRGRRRTEARPA